MTRSELANEMNKGGYWLELPDGPLFIEQGHGDPAIVSEANPDMAEYHKKAEKETV